MPLEVDTNIPTHLDRFMSFVEVTNDCWYWKGVKNPQNYGMFGMHGVKVCAHRVSYELFVAKIPQELVIDHICHNKDLNCKGVLDCLHRSCVNPEHLQVVTQKQNLKNSKLTDAGKERCKRGHEFGEQRGYNARMGYRRCYVCERAKSRRNWLKEVERRKSYAIAG